LDRGVADRRVVADHVLANGCCDVDAVSVPGDQILFNDIARCATDYANPEIVWRFGVSVPMRCVQPDPAVMSDDSYAAARQSWIAGAVANGGVFLDQGVERSSRDEDARAAVRRNCYAFDARTIRTGNLDAMIAESLDEPGASDNNVTL
jgi:hypothetical protein